MYKNLILLVVVLAQCFTSTAQEFSKLKTDLHLPVNGTNIFLIPPASFVASQNFKGFQNPDDQTSMIMVVEIPGPFSEVSKGFTTDMLKSQAMTLINKKPVEISGIEGYLLEIEQTAYDMDFAKHILVYGNDKSSTLINGVYLKKDIELGKAIKQSILSTYLDKTLDIDPREALDYTLDESAGSLQFHSVIGNGMLFNRDLKTPTQSADQATLITDKSFAKVAVLNKKSFCENRLAKYPDSYTLIEEKGINEVEIDGLKGYELYAINNTNEKESMFQVILFEDDGGYFLFCGTYLTQSNKAEKDIRETIKTFKRK